MKTFFFAALIGIILVVGGVIFDRCIEEFSEEMLKGCEFLGKRIEDSSSSEIADEIDKYLNRKKTLLASIINHDSIDEIEVCITEIRGYLNNGDTKEAMVRCDKLRFLVSRLPDEYGLSLQNIL